MQLAMRSGQTLLEGIIAIAVVTVGLMAVVGLAIGNSASALANSDRAVATALAREGLEVAKHVRDSNWLAGAPFSVGLLTQADGSSLSNVTAVPRSTFDTLEPTWSLTFGSYGDFLSSDTVVSWLTTAGQERFVQAQGGTPTKFRRILRFRALCRQADGSQRGTDFSYHLEDAASCLPGLSQELIGAQVTSEVRWQQGLVTKTAKLELRLFDWR